MHIRGCRLKKIEKDGHVPPPCAVVSFAIAEHLILVIDTQHVPESIMKVVYYIFGIGKVFFLEKGKCTNIYRLYI